MKLQSCRLPGKSIKRVAPEACPDRGEAAAAVVVDLDLAVIDKREQLTDSAQALQPAAVGQSVVDRTPSRTSTNVGRRVTFGSPTSQDFSEPPASSRASQR